MSLHLRNQAHRPAQVPLGKDYEWTTNPELQKRYVLENKTVWITLSLIKYLLMMPMMTKRVTEDTMTIAIPMAMFNKTFENIIIIIIVIIIIIIITTITLFHSYLYKIFTIKLLKKEEANYNI